MNRPKPDEGSVGRKGVHPSTLFALIPVDIERNMSVFQQSSVPQDTDHVCVTEHGLAEPVAGEFGGFNPDAKETQNGTLQHDSDRDEPILLHTQQ